MDSYTMDDLMLVIQLCVDTRCSLEDWPAEMEWKRRKVYVWGRYR